MQAHITETAKREILEGPPAVLRHGLAGHGHAAVVQKNTRVGGAGADGGCDGGGGGIGGYLGGNETEAVREETAQGVIWHILNRGLVGDVRRGSRC